MRVVRVILMVTAIGMLIGAGFFLMLPPAGEGFIRYIPSAMLVFFAVMTFTVWLPMVSRLDHGSVLWNGLPATATIVDVADTNATVNEQPVFLFTLDVQHPDGSVRRATTRQIVSRTSLGAIKPGLVVAVRVDPKKPDRVAIEPTQPDGPPTAPSATTAGSTTVGTVMKASDIVRDGIQATAVVKSSSLTGSTFGSVAPDQADPSNADDPIVLLDLHVTAPDGTGFDARGIHRVPSDRLSSLGPGQRVPVAYLARDPANSTAIDWNRV